MVNCACGREVKAVTYKSSSGFSLTIKGDRVTGIEVEEDEA